MLIHHFCVPVAALTCPPLSRVSDDLWYNATGQSQVRLYNARRDIILPPPRLLVTPFKNISTIVA